MTITEMMTIGIQGTRAVRRLGGRQLATAESPVVFDANIAGSLIGHFVSAASGSSLYRRSSFLLDRLGTRVFAPGVTILEEPHQRAEMATRRVACGWPARRPSCCALRWG